MRNFDEIMQKYLRGDATTKEKEDLLDHALKAINEIFTEIEEKGTITLTRRDLSRGLRKNKE
jgi:hypothetical protein